MSGINVFISYRFADEDVAKVLEENLTEWNFPADSIFRAGSIKGGIRPGAEIPPEIMAAIKRTDLFILVYTEQDEDWSFCMWELGVATGHDTKETSVVVLQCGDKVPRVRSECLTTRATDKDAISALVDRIHTDRSFLVPNEEARQNAEGFLNTLSQLDQGAIQKRADKLCGELTAAIPRNEVTHTHRLQYLELSMASEAAEHSLNLYNKIQSEESESEKDRIKQEMLQHVARNSVVQRTSKAAALREFDYDDFPERPLTIEALIESWNEEAEETYGDTIKEDDEQKWIDHFLYDLVRAVASRPSRPSGFGFRALKSTNRRLQPMIVSTRTRYTGERRFDVYLYRMHKD